MYNNIHQNYALSGRRGGPVLIGSTTLSKSRLTAGLRLSGLVNDTTIYATPKKDNPPNHAIKPWLVGICWQSKSNAVSGATPSSHTASLSWQIYLFIYYIDKTIVGCMQKMR